MTPQVPSTDDEQQLTTDSTDSTDSTDTGDTTTGGLDDPDADTDEDGLSNGDEAALGTDPGNPDTDGDTLLDGFEVEQGTDPLLADTDGDGLDDAEEADLGTDPLLADTDGDTLLDGEEGVLGLDPLVADTDGDALSDSEELELGTDPLVADTDEDGLLDGEEGLYGADPLVADTDGDGLLDGEEVLHGADPTLEDTDGDGYTDRDEVHEGHDPADAEDRIYVGGWPYVYDKSVITEPTATVADVGDRIARLRLVDQFGDEVDLYDLYNTERYVYIDVSASWCGPCQDLAGWLEGTYVEYLDPYDAVRGEWQAGNLLWITVLSQGQSGGVPATTSDVEDWFTAYPNDDVILLGDTTEAVPDYVDLAAWPTSMLLAPDLTIECLDIGATPCLAAAEDAYGL